MGDVVNLPTRRRVPKPAVNPPRPAARIDAAVVLREYEQTKKFVTELATSPLMQDVQRTLPTDFAAGERARRSEAPRLVQGDAAQSVGDGDARSHAWGLSSIPASRGVQGLSWVFDRAGDAVQNIRNKGLVQPLAENHFGRNKDEGPAIGSYESLTTPRANAVGAVWRRRRLARPPIASSKNWQALSSWGT
jgi:hypothetical protein